MPRARSPRENEAKARYVYVLERGAFVKVGISVRPKARASKLSESSPEQIVMAFTHRPTSTKTAREVEAAAHRLLAPWRARGEWFRCGRSLALLAVKHADTPTPDTEEFFRMKAEEDRLYDLLERAERAIPRGSRTIGRAERVKAHSKAWDDWADASRATDDRFPALSLEADGGFRL